MGIRYIQILSMEIPIELNVSNFKERSQQNTENRYKPGSARQRIGWEKTEKQIDGGEDEKLIKESTGASAANEINTTYKNNMNTFLVHKENSLENVSFVMHTYIHTYIYMYIWYIYTYIYISFLH